MRPLDPSRKGQVTAPYVAPASLDLSAVALASTRVFATAYPTMSDCLGLWEEEVTSGPVAADKAVVLPRIKRAVDRAYRCAATPLLEAYGRYCAYCESPISELVQVEHLLPKSQYPPYAVDADNLLLACGPCNRRKSDTPTRAHAAAWITTANPGPAQYEQAIRDQHYCWPDRDPSRAWLPLQFEAVDNGNWTPVSDGDAVAADLVQTSPMHGVPVRADLPALNLWDVEIRVVVTAGSTSAARGTEMIGLCGLNETSTGTNDNRVHHRTRVWLDAVAHWHAELGGATAVPSGLSRRLLDVAGFSGCFSVWAATGEAILPGLSQLFTTETAQWFPGTDATRM